MERMVRNGDAELCAEGFGSEGDPALLLIGGAAGSRDAWDDELCARLAAGGRFVVRYDHRDTGRSTSWPAGEPGYGGDDLVADVLAILDGFAIAAAHLVGISMGGAMAQLVAALHPERVASLTLISTTFASGGPADLPGTSDAVAAVFAEPGPEPDWTDRAAVIEHLVAAERPFAGPVAIDEGRLRAMAARTVDRTRDVAAMMTNHWILEGGPAAGVEGITAPTLVVHGTADPLFPFAHGEALAAAIPGARLVALPGVGHQMPPPQVWDVLVPAVLDHTGARPAR